MAARVGIGGLASHVDRIALLLQAATPHTIVTQPSLRGHVPPWTLVKRLWKYAGDVDLYYGISYGQWPRYLFARLRGRASVCHWVGTDVLRLLKRPLDRWWFNMVIRHCIDCHLAVSDNLVAELATVGVKAQLVPLTSHLTGNVVPLPDRFTVLAYLPARRADFYGAPIVMEIAKRNPQWRFLIVGRNPPPEGQRLANVTEMGWADLPNVYPQVSVLVRPTVHDGLPRMVLEALSWGRYVVFSRPFPYTLTGQTVEEIEAALQKVSTWSEPNYAGAEYVREHYNEALIIEKLAAVLDQVLGNPSPSQCQKDAGDTL